MKYLVFIVIIVIFFLGLSLTQLVSHFDGKLHLTICDVGQGDAVFIRTPRGQNILFDGGPDNKVLECLEKEIPFWEKKIDLMILSHPHADHLNGFIDVLKIYRVKQFITIDVANKTDGYDALRHAVEEERIKWQVVDAGDVVRTSDGVTFTVLGPTREYIEKTAVDGKYITSSEFASLEMLVSFRDFDVLLTGDSQHIQLQQAVSSLALPQVEVLQVPHHGSKTGLTEELVAAIHPDMATISVGEKNTYGHPSPLIIDLLQKVGSTILRTDKEGDLRLKSDGKSYSIE